MRFNSQAWTLFVRKQVRFYGNSSFTAQNGLQIHPQGKQPPNRSNYSDLINKLQEQTETNKVMGKEMTCSEHIERYYVRKRM